MVAWTKSFRSKRCESSKKIAGREGMIARGRTDTYRLYLQLLNMYGRQNWWPARTKFEIVVGAILTQQTSWRNVELAIRNLKRRKLLTMERLAKASEKTLQACTYPTGFYKQKARRIRNVAYQLLRKTGGNLSRILEKPLEKSREALLGLDGIGKETGDSILLYAGNRLILPVDFYTFRIIGRAQGRKGTYDSMQSYLQAMLPRKLNVYQEFHALVVKHAKTTCLNSSPKCANCFVNPCIYRLEHCLSLPIDGYKELSNGDRFVK